VDKRLSLRNRSAGVLLHPTSLPGPHGIGDLGPEALRFAAALSDCGQSWWQMLPVGPVGAGDSPYASPSAFAGSPLLVSLKRLAEDGLLEPSDLRPRGGLDPRRVHYPNVAKFKEARLRKAFAAFEKRLTARTQERERFEAFCAQSRWLPDFALFCALKDAQRGAAWTQWPSELRRRHPAALEKARGELQGEIRYHGFVQYQFSLQWERLRGFCADLGVGLIGDVPIYVAHDSADVWSRQDLFHLDGEGRPSLVAGVPPDYFSKTGQLWGNPLYRWDVLKAQDYGWWLERLRAVFARFDAARLDHFIGFHNYWEIPGGAKDAVGGRWRPGPGADFFEKVQEALGSPELIAEDLGVLTPEVVALRQRFDFPGMSVVQFAFSSWDERSQPHRFPRRSVAYTGTHDNDTSVGWLRDQGGPTSTRTSEQVRAERENVLRYLGAADESGAEIHWEIVRLALKSPADTAIIPVQDLLGRGSQDRMNLPGTATGNWQWRLQPEAWSPQLSGRLGLLTGAYGRGPRRWTS
jgi:4-alpha-glucanotransferase